MRKNEIIFRNGLIFLREVISLDLADHGTAAGSTLLYFGGTKQHRVMV